MKKIVLPMTLILVGIGWLLTSLGALPGVKWWLPATLAFFGAVVLVFDTISRFTFTIGLTLWCAAIFSVLQQAKIIPEGTAMPLTLLSLGGLWILSYILIRSVRYPIVTQPIHDDKKN